VTYSTIFGCNLRTFFCLTRVFENLLRRFCDASVFAGVFKFPAILLSCYDCAFWELCLRINFPWEISLQWNHWFWQCGFLCHEKIHGLYRHGTDKIELMQPQQFNILRKRTAFLSKLLKTLTVTRLSAYARGLSYVCGSFV